MPLYDFKCFWCGKVFEAIVPAIKKRTFCECGWSAERQPAAPSFRVEGFSAKNNYSTPSFKKPSE